MSPKKAPTPSARAPGTPVLAMLTGKKKPAGPAPSAPQKRRRSDKGHEDLIDPADQDSDDRALCDPKDEGLADSDAESNGEGMEEEGEVEDQVEDAQLSNAFE